MTTELSMNYPEDRGILRYVSMIGQLPNLARSGRFKFDVLVGKHTAVLSAQKYMEITLTYKGMFKSTKGWA